MGYLRFLSFVLLFAVRLSCTAQDSVVVNYRTSIGANLLATWTFMDRLNIETRHNSDAISFSATYYQTPFHGWMGMAEYRRYKKKDIPALAEFFGYLNGGIARTSYYDIIQNYSYAPGTVSFIALGIGERINLGRQMRFYLEGTIGAKLLNAGSNVGRDDISGPTSPINIRINFGFQFYKSKSVSVTTQPAYKMKERKSLVSISCSQPLGFVSKARIKIEYKWKRNAILLDMSGHYLQATGVQSYLEFRKYLVDFDVRVQNFMYWKGGWGRTTIWDLETGRNYWPLTNYYLAGFGVGRRIYAERNDRFFAEGTVGVKYAYAPGAPALEGNGVMFRVVGPGSFVDLNFQIGYCIAGD